MRRVRRAGKDGFVGMLSRGRTGLTSEVGSALADSRAVLYHNCLTLTSDRPNRQGSFAG